MEAIWAIARRDLRAALGGPLAWLVLAAWLLLTNGVFAYTLYQVHGTPGASQPLSLTALAWAVTLFTPLAPALTMGLYAQERAWGTWQLLLAAPIREHELVLGKFLAGWLLLALLPAATLVQQVALWLISDVHVAHVSAAYLGLLLTAGLVAAMGGWLSLLADSAPAAYVLTFAGLALLLLFGLLEAHPVLGWLAQAGGLGTRMQGFLAGVLRPGDVAWFLAGTGGFLLLTHAALRARRIHG